MKPIKLFWWSPRRALNLLLPEVRHNSSAWLHLGLSTKRPLLNFGDELSPVIVTAVTGRPVKWSAAATADLVAVGSIMELTARTPSLAAIWGTGLRADTDALGAGELLANLGPVLAVRGPNSRAALRLTDEVPLGDPGLLATRLIDRSRRPSNQTLVVPHFSSWNSAYGRGQIAQLKSNGFRIAPPSLSPMDMIHEIADARFVLSSSLHGVVIAHSLGVPAQLLANGSTSVREPMWKYHDYFDSLGCALEPLAFEELGNLKALDQVFQAREGEVATLQSTAAGLATGLEAAIRAHTS